MNSRLLVWRGDPDLEGPRFERAYDLADGACSKLRRRVWTPVDPELLSPARCRKGMRVLGAIAVLGLVFCVTTSAKEIRPGELLICGAKHCHTVRDPATANAFAELLWGNEPIVRAPTPRVGSPVFQLRFKDGLRAGLINATAIRVNGLYCGRFRRGRWYRLPRSLRGLGVGLEPRRFTATVPRSC
jgi:hypothetical protein